MTDELEYLANDFERAEFLQNLLVNFSTGGQVQVELAHYQFLRTHFLDKPDTKPLVPDFVRKHRDLSQFWQFIKQEYGSYAERRTYLWNSFRPLLDYLESGAVTPSHGAVSEGLTRLDEEGVQTVWAKALERRKSDPEGAITAARTLLESVCKNILDEAGVEYSGKADLPELYRATAGLLEISPSQHTQEVFKQILGGCTSVVIGLGTLRNRIGDAHGQGKRPVKPAPRHAELAVNLAGSLALFLVETWRARK